MQKWYNELSKGQKLTVFIPSLALGIAIGGGLGDAGGALVGCMVVIAPFIFFELGSTK